MTQAWLVRTWMNCWQVLKGCWPATDGKNALSGKQLPPLVTS